MIRRALRVSASFAARAIEDIFEAFKREVQAFVEALRRLFGLADVFEELARDVRSHGGDVV